jgi:hypothetical protein
MAITIADNQGNAIDQNNPLPVDLTTSEAIIPTDIQSHLQSTIQTHNAVSVVLSGTSTESNFHDSDGFDQLKLTVLNDNATAQFYAIVLWSNDGTTVHGAEYVLTQAGSVWSNSRTGEVSTKARYFKIVIGNADSAAAHTMSAWAYLKA